MAILAHYWASCTDRLEFLLLKEVGPFSLIFNYFFDISAIVDWPQFVNCLPSRLSKEKKLEQFWRDCSFWTSLGQGSF